MPDDTASTTEPRVEGADRARRAAESIPTGEWLFERDGQVFGPVDGAKLVQLLMDGAVGALTRVAPDGKSWGPLESVPDLLIHLKKAEARARVEAEATAARARQQRREVLRWSAISLGFVSMVLAVAAVAWHLAITRPWQTRSALLDDFGDSIRVGVVRVREGDMPPAPDEVALPHDPGKPASRSDARPKRVATALTPAPKLAANGTTDASGLVLTQYDPARIEQTVALSKGTLAPCVRDEARRSPELVGEIPIEFAVGNDGKVAALWIGDSRFKSGELRDCLLEKLRQWTFDPFPGQRPIVSLAFRIEPH